MLRCIFHRRSPINPASTSNFTTPPSQFSPFIRYFSSSAVQPHNQRQDESYRDPDGLPRLFVVQPRIRPETHLKASLEEALNLANSLEQQRDDLFPRNAPAKEMPPHVIVQNPAAKSPRADTYFGVGTVGTVKCHLDNLEAEEEVDAIFVNATLRGVQQRNLEFYSWPGAELAALMCKRSRLVRVRGPDGRNTFGGFGETEVVSAKGRGSGGRGFISGAGETEIQLQRHRILDRRQQLLSEIAEVRRTRATQRAWRKRQNESPGQEIPTVAVVGYTNGKSTLVSKLSNSYVYSDDRLFATVDPKLRSVMLPSGRKVLLSDTVGFISNLPVQLVEAFHATLEEVIEADLLVHVLDSSAPILDEHRQSVMEVLRKINVPEEKLQNMIELLNKVDLLEENSETCQLDDGEYSSNLSGEEDAGVNSDLLTDQHDGNQNTDCKVSGDFVDGIYHEQAYDSDDSLHCDDQQDPRVSHDDCSIGSSTVKGQPDEVLGDQKSAPSARARGSQPQSESTGHVRTSAVTGIGLQQLLELIDDKLKPCQVVERSSIFDQKWRPPHKEDNRIAT